MQKSHRVKVCGQFSRASSCPELSVTQACRPPLIFAGQAACTGTQDSDSQNTFQRQKYTANTIWRPEIEVFNHRISSLFQYMTAYEQCIFLFSSVTHIPPLHVCCHEERMTTGKLPNIAKLFTYHLRISETKNHNEEKPCMLSPEITCLFSHFRSHQDNIEEIASITCLCAVQKITD